MLLCEGEFWHGWFVISSSYWRGDFRRIATHLIFVLVVLLSFFRVSVIVVMWPI